MPIFFQPPAVLQEVWMAAAVVLPLLFGAAAMRWPGAARWGALTVLPALLLSFCPPHLVTFESLLLGTSLFISETSALWLFLTSVLWLSAGWFGSFYMADDNRKGAYTFFFLGSMTGNIGVILAGDPIAFITCFALMSFLSYGLVIHDRKPLSVQAGRIYMGMAVFGEVLQFAGLARLLLPLLAEGRPLILPELSWPYYPDSLTLVLILSGFGVKAGLLGLHMWLPLAHPVAPTPASAVLSGSMIKTGLIGWMLFLPLGRAAYDTVGTGLMVLGVAGAFFAAIWGVFQRNPKAVLAYSSVSQMGLIITLFGVGLRFPAGWDTLQWAVIIYAAHHAFAKCALFLSVGLRTGRPGHGMERILLWAGVGLSALALCGAPWTSGMVAKKTLKSAIDTASSGGMDVWISLLTWGAVGTTLLMVRFIHLLKREGHHREHLVGVGIWAPWLLLMPFILLFSWLLAGQAAPDNVKVFSDAKSLAAGFWPIAAGLTLYVTTRLLMRPGTRSLKSGDLVWLLLKIVGSACHAALKLTAQTVSAVVHACRHANGKARSHVKKVDRALLRAEELLGGWTCGGLVFAAAGAVLLWLAVR